MTSGHTLAAVRSEDANTSGAALEAYVAKSLIVNQIAFDIFGMGCVSKFKHGHWCNGHNLLLMFALWLTPILTSRL